MTGTYRNVIQTVRSNEYMSRKMLERVRLRGPIIIVKGVGDFEKTPGAMFMTALVALPGETQEACIARHGLRADAHDCVFTFQFNPQLDRDNHG